MDVLKNLEKQVHAASEQLATLRKQNRGLKTKVKKLEAEIAEGTGNGDWAKERGEIRDRVTRLTKTLEGLL